jgi:hypothetical protein
MKDFDEIEYMSKKEARRLIKDEVDDKVKQIKKNSKENTGVGGIFALLAGVGLILWLISWKSLFWCLLLLGLILVGIGLLMMDNST